MRKVSSDELYKANPTELRNERKHLKKLAESTYPHRKMGWVGGLLFFLDTKERVPGIKAVVHSDQEAKGLQANHRKGYQEPVKTFAASASSQHNFEDDRPWTRRSYDNSW